ncbi:MULTISPECIES: helix-turn-helix domain-containing protein [unclassified Providencia]|uniref:helix-turn-helix domain-containing protein n=1 Tax=unclassified Providencia TaxID=2633465 RepID=UPI0013DFD333|nr:MULTISPECIES: helix-turn-helix transcriptional regulator [unclassified Providencia]QIF56685.1 helix-turn-helix transcriptional regulator [Providencia sp. 1701011]QIF60733.1 helix-turn-helix transcriptional regulator [Providencia sp. 1701091]
MKANIISSHVGNYLRKSRKEKNMTGKQLAELINISQQQVSRYETGTSSLSLDQLNEILTVLDKRWIEMICYIDCFSEENKRNNINLSKKTIAILLNSMKDI